MEKDIHSVVGFVLAIGFDSTNKDRVVAQFQNYINHLDNFEELQYECNKAKAVAILFQTSLHNEPLGKLPEEIFEALGEYLNLAENINDYTATTEGAYEVVLTELDKVALETLNKYFITILPLISLMHKDAVKETFYHQYQQNKMELPSESKALYRDNHGFEQFIDFDEAKKLGPLLNPNYDLWDPYLKHNVLQWLLNEKHKYSLINNKQIKEVHADGSCLFHALAAAALDEKITKDSSDELVKQMRQRIIEVANTRADDQLSLWGNMTMRDYIIANFSEDDEVVLPHDQRWNAYLERMSKNEWGTLLESSLLCNYFFYRPIATFVVDEKDPGRYAFCNLTIPEASIESTTPICIILRGNHYDAFVSKP